MTNQIQDVPPRAVAGGLDAPVSTERTCSTSVPGNRRKRNRKLVLLAFVVLSLALSLVLVEIVGRLVLGKVSNDARYYQALEGLVIRSAPILEETRTPGKFDKNRGYALSANGKSERTYLGQPYTESTNSLGFRSREIEPRIPGEYRVMLVGDSFFFSSGVDDKDSLGVQLEEVAGADAALKRMLRVYNFGHPGYCGVQELIVTRTYAERVKPDALVLGFFAPNDVIPNALTEIDGEGDFVPLPDRIERFRGELRSELGLWRYSMIARVLSLTTPSASRMVYRIGSRPWVLERNFEVIREFKRYCDERGIKFGIVFQHTTDSLSGGWRAALYNSDVVHQPLTDFCERSGIPSVDMRSEFQRDEDWTKFILVGDSHCSAKGVRRTAEAIYRDLVKPNMERPDGQK